MCVCAEELYGGGIKECYVLTPMHLFMGVAIRPIRQTRNGYWKALGCSDDKICGVGGVTGVKRRLCFFEGELGKERKTNWNMVEYRLRNHNCSIECDHRRPRVSFAAY